ncbi:ferredoxin-NADP reductase [Sphingomonas sp. Leaf231]|uniref:ferredoxin--NADP reductase n=1 Tax=Sphingomonas sp. Leaf231 TaxID=1736301 RepID=UPI0006F935C3|nr:ferredoxin--NADP reductase [Sphingomonas sp. Leaf231]KQN94504.1 ferredoxin-NADP reductase [Sphingomonas sp. Leaf231]
MTDLRAPVLIPESTAFNSVAVKWVRHWNEHLFSFAVERPASFRFRSGEFVMIGLPGEANDDGKPAKPVMRAYSIASPAWAEELEFLSIKVPGGPLTGRLQAVEPGDQVYLGRKPTGTLVLDALLGGKRLFLLSTGTGLAPFLSVARDPDVYERFEQVVIVHGTRRVDDLACREALEARLADDPLVSEQAATQFHYLPAVTREDFHTTGRIPALIENGRLFQGLAGEPRFDPENDRVMLCGSTAMIREIASMLEHMGFVEGSNANPGQFVIERAFVD